MNTELFIIGCTCCMGCDSVLFLSIFISELQLHPALRKKKKSMKTEAFCSILVNFSLTAVIFGPEVGEVRGCGGTDKGHLSINQS